MSPPVQAARVYTDYCHLLLLLSSKADIQEDSQPKSSGLVLGRRPQRRSTGCGKPYKMGI